VRYLLLVFIVVGFLYGDVKKSYYPSGVLSTAIPYKNAKKEGIAKYYYE